MECNESGEVRSGNSSDDGAAMRRGGCGVVGAEGEEMDWLKWEARSMKSEIETMPSPLRSPSAQVAFVLLKLEARVMKSAMETVPSRFKSPVMLCS